MTGVAAPPQPSVADHGPPAPHEATASAPRALSAPTGPEWFDIGGVALLIGIGLFGFGAAYGGTRYLIAGLVGMVLGLAVAWWGARTRQPLIVVVVVTVAVFFLFGAAVAVPDDAIAGVLPSPAAAGALIDGAISGWARLVTATPPVGTEANLLVVPYTCGLVAAVAALTIARRTRRVELATLPPVAVLALSILFGTEQPASLVVQGAAFAVVALSWVALRRRGMRRVDVGVARSRRVVGTIAVLGLAGAAALVLGDRVPGATSNPRFVLREHTEPPFDPRSHPSPLSSYRRYANEGQLRETTLFEVQGLTAGERLRLAVMDSYDGVVFAVGSGSPSSGYFERVGEQIPIPVDGDARKVTVTIKGYSDVWVPSAGYLDSIEFDGQDAEALRDGFRYNPSTGVGASVTRLRNGDRYTTAAVLPPEEPGDGEAASTKQPDIFRIEEVDSVGGDYASAAAPSDAQRSAPSDFDVVKEGLLASINAEGASSDGDDVGGFESRPGHHARRLLSMVEDGGVMIGNDEQYAPLLALMARSFGVPARVVMGFAVPEGATADQTVAIKGEHVEAWVEVDIDGVGWVPVGEIEPTNDPVQRPRTTSTDQSTDPPPPPPTTPPVEDDEVDTNKVKDPEKKDEPGFAIPGIVLAAGAAVLLPLAVLAAITGLIGGLKSRRRQRRRTTGPPSTRVAGGWSEIVDLAEDLGSPIPVLATRREGAQLVGSTAAVDLASHADAGIFGSATLDEPWVDRYWADVDGTRAAMTSELSRFERWRVLVSLASLRSSFVRRRLGPRGRRSTSRSHITMTGEGQ